MNESYDLQKWAAATSRGRRVFNYHFQMDGSEIPGWKLIKKVTLTATEEVKETAFFWSPDNSHDQEVVRIDVAELPDWRSAQKQLAASLEQSMRPAIPPGTGRLASLGDVNFVARAPQSDLAAATSFTLGNLCVTVRSVEKRTVDVSSIAVLLEKMLGDAPALKKSPKGGGRSKTMKQSVKAKGERVLYSHLTKEIPDDTWVKIIAPEGELRRDRDTLVFHGEKSGEVSIESYSFKKKR